jgi:hypothetical protein
VNATVEAQSSVTRAAGDVGSRPAESVKKAA